jgi:hypothetical protein
VSKAGQRPLRRALALAALVPALVASACSTPRKGALILAISTDMQVPKDINVVSVYVTTSGVPKFNYLGRVRPDGTVAMPSTLAVVEPESQNAQVRIRVIAFQTQSGGGANARVLRDVLTTVPHQVVAMLRVPLSFLDDGSGQGPLSANYVPGGQSDGGKTHLLDVPDGPTLFDPESITSSCDWVSGQQTSVNGVCTSAAVDSATLPPYSDAEVFGDGGLAANGLPAGCFDVASCFANAMPAPNLASGACNFPLPSGADPSTLNVALVSDGTGACLASGCYVPLPNDPSEGWALQGQLVQLAPGVCTKIAAGATLVTAQGCPAEQVSQPVCQPGEIGGDAGSPEAGEPEAGEVEASSPDATPSDATVADATMTDGTIPDANLADGGLPDAAAPDATVADASVDAMAGDSGPDAGAPLLTITPPTWNFGNVPVSMPSIPESFTVQNAGTGAAGILAISFTGPPEFTASSDGCSGKPLAAGNSCVFQVTFTPAATGSVSGTVTVAASGGPVVNATLSGTAP